MIIAKSLKKKKEIENTNCIRGVIWNRQKGTYYTKFTTTTL